MTPGPDFADVPSPIDLRDEHHARAWVADTLARRPWRSAFLARICAALNGHFDRPFSALELGSGPGHLAAAVLASCRVGSYLALDFSDAMHALAREHLGESASRIGFVTGDFRERWVDRCGTADAVLTLQAAHETRHKRHLPAFLEQAREALRPDGLFLYCDHYWEPGSGKHPELFAGRTEQPLQLRQAGFAGVTLLLDRGGMALYACTP